MTMKINVGLSRKIGQPNFGSLGASCHLDLELAPPMLREQPQWAQVKIREAFTLCRQSIDAELAQSEQLDLPPLHPAPAITGPSHWQQEPSTVSSRSSGGPRPATPAQVKAIHTIAGKTGVTLASELSRRFGVAHPQQLSLRQASEMIDYLKASLTPTPA